MGLKKIVSECGIIFQVVKNFKGAPVQAFIKKTENKIILSITIKASFADIFWFTLFHEIGHLLNGDIVNPNFVDAKSDMKDRADQHAKEILIDERDYDNSLKQQNMAEESIINFAKQQNVQPFIVVGRIQKESDNFMIFSNLRKRYKWET